MTNVLYLNKLYLDILGCRSDVCLTSLTESWVFDRTSQRKVMILEWSIGYWIWSHESSTCRGMEESTILSLSLPILFLFVLDIPLYHSSAAWRRLSRPFHSSIAWTWIIVWTMSKTPPLPMFIKRRNFVLKPRMWDLHRWLRSMTTVVLNHSSFRPCWRDPFSKLNSSSITVCSC